MSASRAFTAAAVLVLSLSLAQCKDDPTAPLVAGEVVIEMTATSIAAIEGLTFSFPGGGAVLGTALAGQDMTVRFTNTSAATPTATFTVGANTMTADVSFGSCRLRVTTSTFPVGQGPQVGDVITVNPCQVRPQGTIQATGAATAVQILLQLGQTPSAAQQAQVSIDPATGVVTVNTVNTGQTVTLTPLTGGTGG